MEKNEKMSLYKLQIQGSKERKSLSGAIKCSLATSNEFWNAVFKIKKMKKTDITPKFIIDNATEKQLNPMKKSGETYKREVWSAWMIEMIVRKFVEK
jgi:hypothetical protein